MQCNECGSMDMRGNSNLYGLELVTCFACGAIHEVIELQWAEGTGETEEEREETCGLIPILATVGKAKLRRVPRLVK